MEKKDQDTIVWGIIGCGNVTEKKSGPAFNKVEHSRLHAVMRRDANLAKDYAVRHGVKAWYNDADLLINDPEVNAVYVATPPDTHKKYAIQAMEAGKAVYVEKPMALNFSEAREMTAVPKATGMPLFVAYYRRKLPGFVKLKALLEEGRIGKLQSVNMQLYKPPSADELAGNPNWRVIPEISGGGHFVDLASHQLDYLFHQIPMKHLLLL